jgi:hypothetical protein
MVKKITSRSSENSPSKVRKKVQNSKKATGSQKPPHASSQKVSKTSKQTTIMAQKRAQRKAAKETADLVIQEQKMHAYVGRESPGAPLTGARPPIWEKGAAALLARFGLTAREELFVVELLKTGSKTKAGKAAHYAPKVAFEVARRVPVKQALRATQRSIAEHLLLDVEAVNGGLSEVAFAPREMIFNALLSPTFEGILQDLQLLPEAVKGLIKTLEIDYEWSRVKVTLEGKAEALSKLSQNLGLTKGDQSEDRTEVHIYMGPCEGEGEEGDS